MPPPHILFQNGTDHYKLRVFLEWGAEEIGHAPGRGWELTKEMLFFLFCFPFILSAPGLSGSVQTLSCGMWDLGKKVKV